MARTHGPNARGKSRCPGGGTAASVAVPRRTGIAGTAGGNQAVSTLEDDGASSRSPPRPAHSRSPSCRAHSKVSLLLRLSPVHLPTAVITTFSLSLPCLGSHPCLVALAFSSSYSISKLSRSFSGLLSRLSSLLPNSVSVNYFFLSTKSCG